MKQKRVNDCVQIKSMPIANPCSYFLFLWNKKQAWITRWSENWSENNNCQFDINQKSIQISIYNIPSFISKSTGGVLILKFITQHQLQHSTSASVACLSDRLSSQENDFSILSNEKKKKKSWVYYLLLNETTRIM